MTRRARIAQLLLVGVVPAALIAIGLIRFTLNHFFSNPPYLLDSGLLSGLVYRDGLLLPPPPIACDYATSFYDVYFAPLISLASAISYLVPLDRIEWFGVVEGILYAPFGVAVYVVASRLEPESALRRLPITMITALAFTFGGLVLWMIGYPHLEAAIPAFASVMVAAFATGRPRLGYACLVLAASVRQDGGFVAATALLPLLYIFEASPRRRTVVIAFLVAIGISVAGMVCQRVFFHPLNRLTTAFFGDPPYAHITMSLLAERVRTFVSEDQVIYFPFLATCAIAAVRRDARYLLGWAGVAPWFVFYFTAFEQPKSSFFAYGAGPFILGLMWVYVHGAQFARRRLRAWIVELQLAVVCAASTLGYASVSRGWRTDPAREMLVSHPKDRAAVHGFVDALHAHREAFGRLRVDYAIAALALEGLGLDESWHPGVAADSIAFHRYSVDRSRVMADVVVNHLDVCTHVIGTEIIVCTRDRLSAFAGLDTEVFPGALALAGFPRGRYLSDARVVVDRVLRGSLGSLPANAYEFSIAVERDASIKIGQGSQVLATAAGTGDLTVRFVADGRGDPIDFEIRAGESRVAITRAQIRVAPAPAAR